MSVVVACGLQREARIIKRVGIIPVIGGGVAARLEASLDDTITEYARLGWKVSAILSSGLAGALDPALKPGDIVVGSLFSGGRPDPAAGMTQPGSVFCQGQELIERLRAALPECRYGAVIGSDSILASIAEKRALYADTGAIAVDMESHIAARVAARHGLPFAVLRTISDSAAHTLPAAAMVGMSPDGAMALGAVLKSLVRHPAQLPALIRTGRDAEKAFTALRRGIDALDGFLPPCAASRGNQVASV